MTDHARWLHVGDDLLRRFGSAVRGAQLYSPSHPLVAQTVAAFHAALRIALGRERLVTLGVVGGEFIVGDVPLPRASVAMRDLLHRLERGGVERIVVKHGVAMDEVAALVATLARLDAQAPGDEVPLPEWPHIHIGRIQIQPRVDTEVVDSATVRRIYGEASKAAAQLWEITAVEGRPDPTQTRQVVDTLAQAVARNRAALVALTALKGYDNYTFTHMVNVSILTMAQARALGVEGAVLREFGVAGLMHDIGKTRTPDEILNKPDRLTEVEFEIMKRHVVDGAAILRRTPGMPPIAPVVAFEHHLRIDGTGYPDVRRPELNLATQLCGIADVYDAMRSQRQYQASFPSDRILAVLQRNDGRQFDQHLVRRFVQIMGIYPPGNLVRLNTVEAGVVLRASAADPRRPRVRVVLSKTDRRLNRPYEVDLLDADPAGRLPSSIVAPLDPAAFNLDPLAMM